MKLKRNVILSIPFLIIFAIAAPVVILYSRGYRYDLKRKRLTKTGVIFVNSSPKGASIILNDKPLKTSWYDKLLVYKKLFKITQRRGSTPTTIDNLIPDKYKVVIEKDNYQKWQKRLVTEAEKTTSIPMVQLFLKNPVVELIQETNIDKFWLSQNKTKIVYCSKNTISHKLKFFNIDSKEESTIMGGCHQIKDIKWSKENDKILIIFPNHLAPVIINLEDKNRIIRLSKFIGLSKKIKWDKTNNDIIWFQKGQNIYSFNLAGETMKLKFNLSYLKLVGEVKDWLIGKNYIFWLRNTGTSLFLEGTPLYNNTAKYAKESISPRIPLPQKNIFFKKQIDNDFLVLADKKSNVYIININNDEKPISLITKAKKIIKNKTTKQILLSGNFEISVLKSVQDNEEKISSNIICRFGQQINQAEWFGKTDYIIYSTQNKIWATETDLRDKINRNLLVKTDSLKYFWVDNRTKKIFFIGKIDEKKGIFQAKIQ